MMANKKLIIVLALFLSAAYLLKVNSTSLQVMLGRMIWPKDSINRQIAENRISRNFHSFFDRDPPRKIPSASNIIVSPADGVIRDISVFGGYYRIVIHLSLWDVHVQRVPLDAFVSSISEEGTRDYQELTKDNYLAQAYQVVTMMNTAIGIVKVRQLTSFNAKRIQLFVKAGSYVKIGDRLGRILLGSTVVIELPKGAILTDILKAGNRVIAGETIIARF